MPIPRKDIIHPPSGIWLPQREPVRGYRPSDVPREVRRKQTQDWRERQRQRVRHIGASGWVKLKRIGPNVWAAQLAVALNNTQSMTNAGDPYTTSKSVTAGGSSTCAFAMLAYDKTTGLSIASSVYGGVSMASCGAVAHNTTGDEYAEAWYLTASGSLPTGANNLVITGAGGAFSDIYANLVSFNGVDQSTPVRAGTYQSNAVKTLTITSDVNDLTATVINGGSSGISSSSQTSDGIDNGGSYGAGSDHSAGIDHIHTWTNPTNAAMVGFSIKAAAAAGGSPCNLMTMGVGKCVAPIAGLEWLRHRKNRIKQEATCTRRHFRN